jgi:hypothetical protein
MGLLQSFHAAEEAAYTPADHPEDYAPEDYAPEDYADVLAGLYRDVSSCRHRVEELHKNVDAYRRANDQLIHYFDANGGVKDVLDTVASHQVIEDLKVVVGGIGEISDAEQRIAVQLEQIYSLNREELNTTGLIRRINEAECMMKRRVEALAQQFAELQAMLDLRFEGQNQSINTNSKKVSEALEAMSSSVAEAVTAGSLSVAETLSRQTVDQHWRHEVELKGMRQMRWLVLALVVLNPAILGLVSLA